MRFRCPIFLRILTEAKNFTLKFYRHFNQSIIPLPVVRKDVFIDFSVDTLLLKGWTTSRLLAVTRDGAMRASELETNLCHLIVGRDFGYSIVKELWMLRGLEKLVIRDQPYLNSPIFMLSLKDK